MGIATKKTLLEFLHHRDANILKLQGIQQTDDSIYLGAVGLSLLRPVFHIIMGFACSGGLSPDAAFRVETVTWPDPAHTALVVVFRQFESSVYEDTPEDIIVGWVPATEADDLAIWLERMTTQLTVLLRMRAERLQAVAEAEAKAQLPNPEQPEP